MIISSDENITDIVKKVRKSDIFVVPTPRWYMLCCMADNEEACNQIFLAKNRPRNKQLLFVVHERNIIYDYFLVPKYSEPMIKELWPGDLFLEFKWKDKLLTEKYYPSFNNSNALVNFPSGFFLKLVRGIKKPIAATSVNISPRIFNERIYPAITLKEVNRFIKETKIKVSLIIDGGVCPQLNNGTIVSCTGTSPVLSRSGTVHERAIMATLENPTTLTVN